MVGKSHGTFARVSICRGSFKQCILRTKYFVHTYIHGWPRRSFVNPIFTPTTTSLALEGPMNQKSSPSTNT